MTRIVITTCVLLAGLALASCTGYPLDSPESDPTSGMQASTATATQLPAVATEPFTPLPVATLPNGPTLVEESFSDNRSNWLTKPDLIDVVAGTYRHVLDCPASGYATTCGNFIKIPFSLPASYRIQIEATVTKVSDGAGVLVGFELRRSDDGYYLVNYSLTKSSYQIERVTQMAAVPIVPETQTDFMASGPGATNVLGIEINSAELMPMLNGNQIAPVHDGNIRTAGDTYLVVLVERGHTAELQLDNLLVERIE